MTHIYMCTATLILDFGSKWRLFQFLNREKNCYRNFFLFITVSGTMSCEQSASHQYLTNVQCCNRQYHSQTIHPTEIAANAFRGNKKVSNLRKKGVVF